jgi:predicted transcriptional regulator
MKARKNKDILNSSFTFPILSKIYNGYRPAQIAAQLGTSSQAVKYYTDKMINAGLIRKEKGDRIKWVIEQKGLLVLKQKVTGSVNSFTNIQTKPVARVIPTRLDNLSFKFKIQSPIPPDDHLHWSEMNNGVSKCSLKYDNHTVELIRSKKEGNGSILIIHLGSKYCFDWPAQLINAYDLSRHYAKQTATQYRLEISDYGSLDKRPHIAFEQDLIAFFTAASSTASISFSRQDSNEKAWIDSSNGTGELETDDPDYAFLYLMMPRTIEEIANMAATTSKWIIGYEKCYLPSLTINN